MNYEGAMSYPTVLAGGTRRARKHHQCFDCYRSIAPGETYSFQSSVCDGSAYTLRQHLDCRDLATQYRRDVGLEYYAYDDGFGPLQDEWADSGEHDALCDQYRGQFPHAVTRMEWADQIADFRMADRLAALRRDTGE